MWPSSRGVFRGLRLLCAFTISLSTGCGGTNVFEEFANKEDGPSLIRAVKDALADGDYAEAVSACEAMSASDAAESEALEVCAAAYFGSCGYTLFTVVNQMTAYSGAPLLFQYFMEQNNGATAADITACDTGLARLRAIGSAANRSDDQNYMAIFSALTNMGIILNFVVDTDDDGTIDANICTDLSDARTNQFGKALWELYRATEVVNSSFTQIDDVKTALDALSTAIDGVNANYNFLRANVDPDAYTADQRRGVKALIREDTIFGLDDGCGNFATCICP